MPLIQRIQDQFQAGAQTLEAAMAVLAEPIAQAVQVFTASLMHEGKILVCGTGAANLLGRHLAGTLVRQLDRERPGLAAIALDPDGVGARDDRDAAFGFARQIGALGHPGDVLCAISTFGNGLGLKEAIKSAQEREMRVVLLTGGEGGGLAELLAEPDVAVCVPAARAARVLETQLLAIHSLCDGIDFYLLGA